MPKVNPRKKKDTFDYNSERSCKTCGNKFNGKFCNLCGEKIIEPSDKSIYNFLGSIINAFTFIDNKFFYTLKLMLTKTGYVSSQYIQGIRVPYIRPASMFFVANLIYFLFPMVNTFNSNLYTQMHDLPYSNISSQVVEARLVEDNITLEEFEIQYNQQSTVIAKLLLIVFVVLIAIPLMILNYSKKKYFIDHLIASLEFNTLLIWIVLIFIPCLIYLLGFFIPSSSEFVSMILGNDFLTVIAAVVCSTIFFLIERRVYKQRIVWAIVKSLVLLPCLIIMLQLYRSLLFFVTMWTL